MRIIVCGASRTETECLCGWVRRRCEAWHIRSEVLPADGLDQFWKLFSPTGVQGVLMGAGDTAGFLAAMRVRQESRDCAILLIDDTDRFAIRSLRLHAVDFLLRPLARERAFRGIDRMLGRM